MAIWTVGANSAFPTIDAAMAAAGPGDTIVLEAGYSNDIATITHDNSTIQGTDLSQGIQVQLAPGVLAFQLDGNAAVTVLDNAGDNTILGGGGDEVITVSGGIDHVGGGAGIDRLIVDYQTETGEISGDSTTGFVSEDGRAVTVEAGTIEHFTIRGGSGINTLTTGAGDDLITTAGSGANTITAGEGNNTVITGGGVDSIDVGAGNNTINAGEGANTITATSGDNTITTGTGADTITVTSGNNTILAGDGANTITATSGNNTIIAGSGVDTIVTSGGSAYIDVGDGANTITTVDGDDTLISGVDTDTIIAGAGNDTITVRGGTDGVAGGAGTDTLIVDYSAAITDVISSSLAGTVAAGYAGNVTQGAGGTVTFAGIENFNITSGRGNDSITTGDGDDTIDSGRGADHVSAGAGSDLIFGRMGDVVDGGEGGTDVDTLSLKQFGPYEIVYDPQNSENGTVYALNTGGTRTGETLAFTNIEQVVACFTTGTLICTDRGALPIETLMTGDLVLTLDHGFKPIVWIGCKDLSGPMLAADPSLQPILIRRGALGYDRPDRDMMVSPQHRMLMSGARSELLFGTHEVLVRAKHLVSLDGIDVAETASVTYVHIMFDLHEVVLADGAWSESFQPGDRSLSGLDADQYEELVKIYPELAMAERPSRFDAARMTLKSHEARVLLAA